MGVIQGFPRYFAMARDGGWWVCDGDDLDKTNLARPVADEPCRDEEEARELSAMLNEEL